MMELIAQNMAPIMFASLILFLLFGYPVAFALAANGLLFFVIGVELAPLSNGSIYLDWNLLGTMPDRLWGVLANETLLAIPFTFMGILLEKSGMAEDWLGHRHRPAVRPGARRSGLCGRDRGRAAGGNDRRGCGIGDRDGSDLAADHAALRL